jgi:glycosyltransferase involved in cell wall biosynthesis
VNARKPRVAYFSPLTPDPSGISDYSEELLRHLATHWELDLFVDGYLPTHRSTGKHHVIDCDAVDPVPLLADYDAVLYHIGNSESHDYIYDTLMRWPGLVVLHELSLQHLLAFRTVDAGRKDVYVAEMGRQHGREGADRARVSLWGPAPAPWEFDPVDYPLNRRVIGQATGVLVHSEFVARGVREVASDLFVARVEHHAYPVPKGAREMFREHRSEGGAQDVDLQLVTAGNLTPSKRVEVLLRGLKALNGRISFNCKLLGKGNLKHSVEYLIESLELRDQVEVLGRVDKDELYCALLDADLSICLREPVLGETSGIVMRSLACGTPVVVTDKGWFSELPDEVAIKISPDDGAGRELASALEDYARNPERHRKMAAAARAYAKERSPKKSAEGYAEFVRQAGTFPNRWAGRGFQRITARLRDLDVEWPGCAAKLRAAHYVEMMNWQNCGSKRALADRRARRLSRVRKAAREAGDIHAPRRDSNDCEDTTVAYDVDLF